MLLVNVCPTYIVIAVCVCVCVCVLARARVLVRVLMCAYVLRNVWDYVGLWWSVWECVRACVTVRAYEFLSFCVCCCVCSCTCVCV